ncbi:unnamed protein product [Ectocarpus sp. CCAP 1310/34]|nr:unnamed protein product [Ectocarpus sp. CCAP 1310/34]
MLFSILQPPYVALGIKNGKMLMRVRLRPFAEHHSYTVPISPKRLALVIFPIEFALPATEKVHFDEEHGVWHLVPPPIAVVVATASDKKIDSTPAGGATRLASQQTEDLETSSKAAEHSLSTSEKGSNTSGHEGGDGFVGSTSSGKSADQPLLHADENEQTEHLLSTLRTNHRRASANGTCLSGSESRPAIEEIDGEGLLGESDAGREVEGTTNNNQMRTISERLDSKRELAQEETTRVPGNDEKESNPSAEPVSEKEDNMPVGTRSGSRSGKGKQTTVWAEQGHPSSSDTKGMKILPQGVDQNKEEDQKEIVGGCGEGQRNGDGIAPGTAPLELSGGSDNRFLQDTGKPDRPGKPAIVELSTATPAPSANSRGFMVKGSAGRDSKGSNAALCVTWRGKPMTLTEPVLISLKESTIPQARVELEEKGEMKNQRRESMSTGSKRDVTDNPWSSYEDSEPARGPASQGRSGDRRREATVDTGSKLGPCAREGKADPSAQHNGRYLEEKHDGSSRLDAVENEEEHRAESKDSQRSGAPRTHYEGKALPMVQRGTPTSSRRPTRQAVFSSEPYFGPPIAACPRAWPAESTKTMACATDGRPGHHARRSHRAGYSSSASDDLQDKQWSGEPAMESNGNR